MRVVVGIDLGSTTTKAVLLDEEGAILGRGITNSRSNYAVACSVARQEALTSARFALLERALAAYDGPGCREARRLGTSLPALFHLEVYLEELRGLSDEIVRLAQAQPPGPVRDALVPAAREVLAGMESGALALFATGAPRKSDFFRDLAGAAFLGGAERVARERGLSFERLVGLFDRAILSVETRVHARDFNELLRRAAARLSGKMADSIDEARWALDWIVSEAGGAAIDEVAFAGTGYGRQTLPFPRAAVRSEILCHGRGAHRLFPGTRTVLDIGGQDTKAIQVDPAGLVTSFQMNDRCAAGCGRYLGYIADELNLGLHELGPLALKARRTVRVNSTCTVFAGAELRERLALGQSREDVLAGLHRSMMLRAMALLARSGGVTSELTFTGGVSKNPMSTKVLRQLVDENYSTKVVLNIHPDSIYMGALGAALFARDDARAGKASLLPTFAPGPEQGQAQGRAPTAGTGGETHA